MSYFLAYRTKKTNQLQYFTNSNGWTKNVKSNDIKRFNKEKEPGNYYQKNKKSKFKTRPEENFISYNAQNSIAKPITKLPDNVLGGQKIQFSSIYELINFFHNNHHVLIMDLEYSPSRAKTEPNKQYISQITGKVLDTPQHFNWLIYDELNLTDKYHIDFLRKTDLPMSEAQKYTRQNILPKIKQFIKNNNIDTVLFWGYGADLKHLEDENWQNIFEDLKMFDLEAQINNELKGNTSQNIQISLQTFAHTLGLVNDHGYHDAYFDVLMINRICNFYANRCIDII